MNSHSKRLIVLAAPLVVSLLGVFPTASLAQSEMTDKIRLENTTPAKFDFTVSGANLGITKSDGTNVIPGNVGIGTNTPTAPLNVFSANAPSPGTVAIFDNNGGPARFRFRNGVNGETWNVGHQSPSGTGLVFSDVGDAVSELLLDTIGNLTIAGTLTQSSDVNRKTGIEPIAGQQILDKVAALPISAWSYKEEPAVRHVGPMAQDFKAAFGLGATETGIAAVDADGVSLASIQALYALVQQQRAEIDALKGRLEQLEVK